MSKKTKVLVTNLGTPEEPTPEAVRAFLAEFLGDPLVVDLPRFVWLPILHGIVLRRRPVRVAALYKKIWTDGASPLRIGTHRIASQGRTWAVGRWRVVLGLSSGCVACFGR